MNDKKPKKGYGFIYKYTSPSGKSYIGQTIRSLNERAGHNGKNYKGCSLFFRAIQKYGFKNFDVEILVEVPRKQLNEQEKKYIHLFNSLAPNGYNISVGGEQIGPSKKARPIYQYSSKDGSFLKKWENISAVCEYYNIKRNVLEDVLGGKNYTICNSYWSYLKFRRFNLPRSIVQIDPTNNKVIHVFPSISSAAHALGKSTSFLRRVIDDESKTAYGYKWKTTQGSTTKYS